MMPVRPLRPDAACPVPGFFSALLYPAPALAPASAPKRVSIFLWDGASSCLRVPCEKARAARVHICRLTNRYESVRVR